MKTSFALISVLVLLACMSETTNANGRLPLVVNPQTLGSAKDTVTVYPCTTHICDACCYCYIDVIPPVCGRCCPDRPINPPSFNR
ncbi:hypothetical protein ABFS82_05G022500 [Erythranthe guttata]